MLLTAGGRGRSDFEPQETFLVWLSYVGKKGGGTGREGLEARDDAKRDDAKHSTNVQDSPQKKECSCPTYQWCQGSKL